MSLSPGARLGPFEVVDLLGRGGMGEVYRARDTKLKREVALKILPAAWARDADRLWRFQREAELLATLNHPNVAAIYGLDESDGHVALVLELVEGPTLADLIGQTNTDQKPRGLALPDALAIAKQIVEALDAAHERGIVHRDLKPANIKVRPDGAVKVLDFGLAKALEPGPSGTEASQAPTMTSPAVTGSGVILGTAAYMSPEQARGQAVDKRSDIWAFGCVLYEMLAGQPAFEADTVTDTLVAIVDRQPDWTALPPGTPERVRDLLQRCLRKDRKTRLRDIGDANVQLDTAHGTVPERADREVPQRVRWSYVLGGAIAVAALSAIVTVALAQRGAPAEASVRSLGANFTQMSVDGSFSIEPALSPDGTQVVYASDRSGDGQLDLWLQPTAGGQPIRLTDDPAHDREPDFSRDSRLAFRSDRAGGGVYVMRVPGGDPIPVAQNGRRPRFSPDGSRLAYWVGSWLGDPRLSSSGVFIVPAIGGASTAIPGFRWARNPIWSPDGRHLLLIGEPATSTSDDWDWWLVPVDGGPPLGTGFRRLLEEHGITGDEGGLAWPVDWTTDGVLFSARLGGSINVWRVAIDVESGSAIDASLKRMTEGAGDDLAPSADNEGRIAFQLGQRGHVSLTIPLAPNEGRTTGTVRRHTFHASVFGSGRNSLDHAGRLLAYPRYPGTVSELWVKDLTTGQDRQVWTTTRSTLNPVMSQSGLKIAFSMNDGTTDTGWVIASEGGLPRKICDGCLLHGWLPGEEHILALNPSPSTTASIVNITSLERVDLVQADRIGRVDISPDGRWLSFTASDGPRVDTSAVWLAPAQPGKPTPRSDWTKVFDVVRGSGVRACGWSPDGRLLYLLSDVDGFRDLSAQRIDPSQGRLIGEPFVVAHLHDPRFAWGSTPFGTAIVSNAFVFNQVEMTGSIWLLEPERDRSSH